jgi:dienelactone hydrolase
MQQQQSFGKGYLSEEEHSLRTTPVNWLAPVAEGGRSFDLIVSSPVRPGRYPVVLYLPGLGEARTAGEAWRKAWAQAGYVVVSVQLLAEDGQAWQSTAARNGDFRTLVRERFSAAAMSSRQQTLQSFLGVLRQHADDPLLANADLGRIVLAGYDLGAYTALAGAGEKFRNGPPAAAVSNLVGVIALSPYADFSGPTFDSRYAAISVPVLSVTGPGDGDNYGVLASASVRTAPFQHMPSGGKYLLSLDDVSHEQLSGSPLRQPLEGEEDRGNRNGGRGDDNRGERSGRGDRSDRGGGEGGMGRGGMGGMGGSTGGRNTNSPNGPGGNGSGQSQAVIAAVTTAFLDALVRQDDIAQEWLRRDARRWLREAGSLTVR